MRDSGVDASFEVIKDETSSTSSDYRYASQVSYYENLRKVSRADILVEVNKQKQSGITIRALEALFFQKKLITDNTAIKHLRMFDPRNIFLIDETFPKGLDDFIKGDFRLPDDDVLTFYEFESWIKRMAEDKPINSRRYANGSVSKDCLGDPKTSMAWEE